MSRPKSTRDGRDLILESKLLGGNQDAGGANVVYLANLAGHITLCDLIGRAHNINYEKCSTSRDP